MIPEDDKNLDIQPGTPDPAINSVSADARIGATLVQQGKGLTEAANDNADVRGTNLEKQEKNSVLVENKVERAARIIKSVDPTFDLNNIEIVQLQGKAVGKAVGSKILLDAWLILHGSEEEIVHTFGHEKAHEGGAISDEALVEAETRRRLKESGVDVGGVELTDKYDAELQAFYEMVSHLVEKGLGSADLVIKYLYTLCLNKDAEAVFELYDKEYISAKDPDTGDEKTDDEKLEAYELFEKAFPMMAVNKNGHFDLSEVSEEEVKRAA